jgi:ActR/RegA family two-component response regulator
MSDATYDLFKGSSQENALWIEAVEGILAATERMNQVAFATSSDCFLFRSGHIVASVQNPNVLQPEIPLAWKTVVLSSNQNQIRTLSEILNLHGLEAICTVTVSQYRDVLSKQPVGLVFCDPNLPDGNYRDVINSARSIGSNARIVLTSRQANWPEFLEAVRVGAFDVISTPCRPEDVESIVIQAKRDDRKMATQPMTSNGRSRARGAA